MQNYIRDFREELGWSKSKLSRRSGVSVSFISEVEAGKKDITVTRLCMIAEAMMICPGLLLSCNESFKVCGRRCSQ